VLLALVAIGCAVTPADEPVGEDVVAVIAGGEVTVAQLDAYFELNLPADYVESTAGEDRDRVLSRLFDNFIEEQVLLVEARRDGIQVTDREVELYLGEDSAAGDEEGGEDDGAPSELVEAAVREGLIVQKYRESIARGQVIVTDEEVDRHLERLRGSGTAEGRVIIRTLMLESMQQAKKIRQNIRRGTTTFAESAATKGGPGQGVPLELPPEDLPEEFQAALAKMKIGWVSQPIEVHGAVYLIKLDSRKGIKEIEIEELKLQAREELTGARSRQVLAELVSELSRESGLELHTRNLPFRYERPDR
jgi:parvulin-like peptidyl-prolyl isomerase